MGNTYVESRNRGDCKEMNIKITMKNGDIIEQDIFHFSVHEAIRVIMLHNRNGTIDVYNMDEIKKFTIPNEAIKGTS